jgi:hypothetical protein
VSERKKRFYVYRIFDGEQTLYVGKGFGRRLQNQRRRFGHEGEVLQEFRCEARAYQRERELIAELKPTLNCNGGGGGPWVRPKPKPRMPRAEATAYREMERIGTRAYAARCLLSANRATPGVIPPEKVALFRQVAYGAA